MSARSVTRTAVLAALASLAALATTPPAYAARNADAEQYVQANASAAFATLGDASLNPTEKQQTFYRLVAQFSDMPRIALWVLGRHGAQLRSDAALRQQWTSAFQDFAIAVYEYRMTRYSGSRLRVVDSSEQTPTSVIVVSEVTPRGQTRTTTVRWRLNRSGDAWRVFDIQVEALNGDTIWLGQLQQQEFLAALGSNGGDIRALMRNIQTQTAAMRQRMTASRS